MVDVRGEMKTKMELNLHNSFSENYNSLTGTIIIIMMTSVAVLYGYGYVFLECSNNIASCLFQIKDYDDQLIEIMIDQKPISIVGIQGKTDLNINALVFTFLAVEFVLFALMHILIFQGTSLRREQFIVYMYRKIYDVRPNPGYNTSSYSPFDKKGFNILPGLYKELFFIIAIISLILFILTLVRVLLVEIYNTNNINITVLLIIIIYYIALLLIIYLYSTCKNFKKYNLTQQDYYKYKYYKIKQ